MLIKACGWTCWEGNFTQGWTVHTNTHTRPTMAKKNRKHRYFPKKTHLSFHRPTETASDETGQMIGCWGSFLINIHEAYNKYAASDSVCQYESECLFAVNVNVCRLFSEDYFSILAHLRADLLQAAGDAFRRTVTLKHVAFQHTRVLVTGHIRKIPEMERERVCRATISKQV